PTCTPIPTSWPISSAMRSRIFGSMPMPSRPSASPLSLSRMRLYLRSRGGVVMNLSFPFYGKRAADRKTGPSGPVSMPRRLFIGNGGSNFGCEVDFFIRDAFAHFKADKLYHFCTGLFHQIADGDVRILDERLVDQTAFRQEFLDAAHHHLLDDVGRLATLGRLGGIDFPFLRNQPGRHVFAAHDLWVGGSHMHGHIASQL